MTNYEKLCEVFPRVTEVPEQAKKICPSIFCGSAYCKESSTMDFCGNKVEDEYDIMDSYCVNCAEDFWDSEYKEGMDLNQATIQDCIDMHKYKNKAVILNDGRVDGFQKEGQT